MIRMQTRVAQGAVVILLCGFAATAHAQTVSNTSRPITLKIGVFSPSNGEARQLFGKSHFLLDGTFDFHKVADDEMSFGAYVDAIFTASGSQNTIFFNEQSNSVNDEKETGRASAYGIGLQARYLPLANRALKQRVPLQPYVGAGFGVYSVYGKQGYYGYDNGNFSGDYAHTATGAGGKFMVGVQSMSGLIGEVSYDRLPDDQGLDLSGYGVSLGYRF